MAEEGLASVATPEPELSLNPDVSVETSDAPQPLIGDDGAFAKDWQQRMLPEDLQGDPSLSSIPNIQTLAKNFVNTKAMVGKNKIVIPDETSDQGVWEEFWRVAGRPDTADDYGFKKPDALPEEHYNEDFAKSAQELFHKIGISKKQADAIFEFNNSYLMETLAEQQNIQELELKETKAQLYKDWGAATEQKLHLGNIAIEQGCAGDEEFKGKIIQQYGNDPNFIRFASNLGEKFSEHGVASQRDIATPTEMKAKIAEAMNTDAYRQADHPQHKQQVDLVQKYFASLHPEDKKE